MWPVRFFVCAGSLFALVLSADSSSSSTQSYFAISGTVTGTITGTSEATSPTGSYTSYSSTITITNATAVLGSVASIVGAVNSSASSSIISSSSQILLQGSATTSATNETASGTATSTSGKIIFGTLFSGVKIQNANPSAQQSSQQIRNHATTTLNSVHGNLATSPRSQRTTLHSTFPTTLHQTKISP